MKKHKFNWVDGLVIAVVVLLIAGTCVRFLVVGRDSGAEDAEFTYQLRISSVRQVTVDSLQIGDTVYEDAGKGEVGVISDISVEDAVTTITYSNGRVRKGAVEDRYDVTLTLTASGTVSENSYKIGTYDIHVNSSDTYFTKYSVWWASVAAIDVS